MRGMMRSRGPQRHRSTPIRGSRPHPARERHLCPRAEADHQARHGDLRAKRPRSSPFAANAKAVGKSAEWDYPSRVTRATKAVAERLCIEPGDDVTRTQYRFFADDLPTMLSMSYEPLDLTRDTDVEQPAAGTLTGVIPRMDRIGVHITQVTGDVFGRAPRPFETDKLEIPQGVPVLAIERTYYTADRPAETADIVVPADQYALS